MALVEYEQLRGQVQACLDSRQFAKAEQLLQPLLATFPSDASLHYQLGVAKAMAGREPEAIGHFQQAIACDRGYTLGYNGLALALSALGDYQRAAEVCARGLQEPNPNLKLYSSYASVLQKLSRLGEAKTVLQAALQTAGNQPGLWCNLAAVLAEMSDKPGAIGCYQKALQINPNLVGLHDRIAELNEYQSESDPHLQTMLNCQQQALPPGPRAELHFGLAKAFEKLNNYQQAANNYRAANDLFRTVAPYQHEQTEQQFSAIKQCVNSEFIERFSQFGNADATPIFIVGMPRSGTSLVEQILASHSQVYGAGELNFIKSLLLRSHGLLHEDFGLALQNITGEKLSGIAAEYRRLLHQFDGNARFITDKMPHNFRFIGLIHCLFPNAKIIHCQRDRRDVVVSNYKANFVAQIRYASGLESSFQFYDAYEDLMAYWRQLLPGRFLDFQYEELVADQNAQTKRLLDYCGLPWQEECLAFYKNQRSVATASSSQVKQPLYNSAVAYWQNFAPYWPELETG
ncbi:tetratricopeptide repeat-containing sulfotransferase family protein [Halioxenophilus sp. WMMB6]|uniref:tetratricopeptide repeat-containing sulfotransferase family protein n=1 Tax=Halioxenophilus sp. WMMB6 TaxID=3073815 RepID=UPI00295E2F5B|nr:sulfotransferase [Halioxenophilus sp. WMMB6]